MKRSARYVKIVEWSEEDRCFVGSCPGLLFGGCHGDDEQAVFSELCAIVDETLDLFVKEGNPRPARTTRTRCCRSCRLFKLAPAPSLRRSAQSVSELIRVHERRFTTAEDRRVR